MIVIYNPLILIEAVLVGGLSFAGSKVFPKVPKTSNTLVFLFILAVLDLLCRYWRVRQAEEA